MSHPFCSPWVAGATALKCLPIFLAPLLLIEEEGEENAVDTAAAGAVSGVLVGIMNKMA
jgi:hypothetical protein